MEFMYFGSAYKMSFFVARSIVGEANCPPNYKFFIDKT